MRTVVVYVHGLWLNGWESLLLRRRLSLELNCETRSFRYSSVGVGLREMRRRSRRPSRNSPDNLHLVGHSMGGLVILELFERWYGSDDGRGAAQLFRRDVSCCSVLLCGAASRREISRNGHSGAASWDSLLMRYCCRSATDGGRVSATWCDRRQRARGVGPVHGILFRS